MGYIRYGEVRKIGEEQGEIRKNKGSTGGAGGRKADIRYEQGGTPMAAEGGPKNHHCPQPCGPRSRPSCLSLAAHTERELRLERRLSASFVHTKLVLFEESVPKPSGQVEIGYTRCRCWCRPPGCHCHSGRKVLQNLCALLL